MADAREGERSLDRAHGQVDTPLTARIVGLTGSQLHGIRHVIGIAHGHDKVDAIAAAVKGGLVDSLVTTAETADALLAQR